MLSKVLYILITQLVSTTKCYVTGTVIIKVARASL